MESLLFTGIAFSFFAIIFLLSRRRLRPADILASVFLLFLALPVFFKLVSIGFLNIPIPGILLSIHSFPFTFGPFLYLYARAEINQKTVFNKVNLLHFIPFMIFAVLPFIFEGPGPMHPGEFIRGGKPLPEHKREYYRMPPPPTLHVRPDLYNEQPGDFKKQFPPPPHERPGMYDVRPDFMPSEFHQPERNNHIPLSVPVICLLLSFITYTFMVLRVLKKHKRMITDYFSYNSSGVNLKWLRWLTICFVISYSFAFLSSQIKPEIIIHPLFHPGINPDIAITFFVFAFCFFAVKQPVIYENTDAIPDGDDPNGVVFGEKKKYQKSGLRDSEAAVYLENLENIMKNEKLYLNGDLTIEDIAKRINIPRHHLTQILSEKLNKNFFMYVNEYRVQEAKEMMHNRAYEDYTIIRIAYDSGFNTKSGFNSVFKKLTGCTPSEYRKNIPVKSADAAS